jgi:hypothetical protein
MLVDKITVLKKEPAGLTTAVVAKSQLAKKN